jgi:hypothetical protein
MIEAYMQVDLNNPLAVAYMKRALKSYEIVSDIFRVNVIQCVTPDTFLEELKDIPNQLTNRSPQELASLHSNYRAAKRMAAGERFWTLEHDAYLRSEYEDVFRMIMSKWLTKKSTISLGMANEFWTTIPEIAELFCREVEKGWPRGPMGLLHRVTDIYLKNKSESLSTYWPANRFKNKEWTNKTGVGNNIDNAYNNPKVILHSPICQILDQKHGGTVVDRPKTQYNRMNDITNPDVKWIDLDLSD